MKSTGKQKETPENISENHGDTKNTNKDTTGQPEENKENISENHTETKGKQEENKEEASNTSTGKLIQNSFKVTETSKEAWEEFSKNYRTKGEAFIALLENFNKEPQTIEVEKEVIKEVEVIKEIEVTKEVPVILNPDQIIIRFDENTRENSRKSRPFLKRDGIITSDDPGEALSQMVNRSVNYFLKNKYDHIINHL